MSAIVDFYRGQAADSEGRYVRDIWGYGDPELEEVHNFIQWLFPLPEPSRFNPDAPLLTAEDLAAFHAEALLRDNLAKSYERILGFLGFAKTEDGQVVEGENFAARVPDVWAYPNHNWLRITRILRSLHLLGLQKEAQALYTQLEALYSKRKFPIMAETFRYWTEAVRQRPLS